MRSGEKIPGYTGFVPYRFENIGLTIGESNRVAESNYRTSIDKGKSNFNSVDPNSRTGYVDMSIRRPEKAVMVSNHSRYSKTWLNGPQHEIRNQSVPGYTGFIPGVQAENVFSVNYGKSTGMSFADKIIKGADHPPAKRY